MSEWTPDFASVESLASVQQKSEWTPFTDDGPTMKIQVLTPVDIDFKCKLAFAKLNNVTTEEVDEYKSGWFIPPFLPIDVFTTWEHRIHSMYTYLCAECHLNLPGGNLQEAISLLFYDTVAPTPINWPTKFPVSNVLSHWDIYRSSRLAWLMIQNDIKTIGEYSIWPATATAATGNHQRHTVVSTDTKTKTNNQQMDSKEQTPLDLYEEIVDHRGSDPPPSVAIAAFILGEYYAHGLDSVDGEPDVIRAHYYYAISAGLLFKPAIQYLDLVDALCFD